MNLFFSSLLLAAFAFFAVRRLRRYLHVFQQQEYKEKPYFLWIAQTRSFDKRLSLALLLLAGVFWFLSSLHPTIERDISFALLFAAFGYFEDDPRQNAKKKLAMTNRAQRIFYLALAFVFFAAVAAFYLESGVAWLVVVQLFPVFVALANFCLMPFEARIQKKIMAEASAILADVKPQVIGVTGSFGKTSVKHILGHILDVNATALYTPGSINTLMGISRVIRENLKPDIRFFVVEMGAYNRGSIEKLCQLTPPDLGVITALGEAHYERFGSLDAVARGKFELAEAVLAKKGGKVVIHESVLAQEYARQFVEANRARFFVCGRSEKADLILGESAQTISGVTVHVRWGENSATLQAPLLGEAHADNIAVAFAVALLCGVVPERAIAALRTVPQIMHRLEVKPQPNGITYIDDAYNSNPKGFVTALNLLALFGAEKGGRRVLITPGIIELGEKHDEIHRVLGAKAADAADIILVVRAQKLATFIEGIRSVSKDKEVHLFSYFTDARAWLNENCLPTDIVLVENDLPDVDEMRLIL